jgi:hypothetical protein
MALAWAKFGTRQGLNLVFSQLCFNICGSLSLRLNQGILAEGGGSVQLTFQLS